MLISFVLCATLALCGGCGEESSTSGPGGTKPPVISGILPPGAGSGTHITIRGSNFENEQGTGSVHVASASAAVDSWSDDEIECTLPGGLAEGLEADVVVTTHSGKSASAKIAVTAASTYRVTTDGAMDHYPCWSPDGEWIYYSSTLSGGANWDIYRIPAIGGTPERVTFDGEADFYPDLNPSTGELAWSSEMAHVSNNEGDFEIFYGFPLCIAPGSACSVTMLTSNASRDLDPAWALTVYMGYSMAYTWEEVDQSGYFLAWKIALRSSGPPVVLATGRQPNFSPDGQWVVYTHQDNIYKIPTGGGTPVQLTDTNHDWYPHWGWTNDKIVFQRTNGGNFEDIFVMNSDGTDVEALVSTRNNEYCPSWSPDCTKVVYYALIGGNFDIYVYVVP
jgi:Tol biopolymer transport system component